MNYSIIPMALNYALEISKWKYENEYSIYSFESDKETLDELLNGDYYVCLDVNNKLIGYFCKGKSAHIPTKENYKYSSDYLDIGLGMNPDLCGKGLGYNFMICGINDLTNYNIDIKLRLTVACFNQRAITLYKKVGFIVETTVTHKASGNLFYIMKNNPPL